MPNFDDLVGKGFQYGGRGPDVFDCFGLVRECYHRTHGILLPDFLSPTDQGAQAAVGAIKLQQWEEVLPAPGVMVAIRVGRFTSHCAFMEAEDTLIHAWKRSGGVTRVPLDEWKARITGFYRYVG